MHLHSASTGKSGNAGGKAIISLTPAGKKYIEYEGGTLVEGKILAALDEYGPMSFSEISSKLHLDAQKVKAATWNLKLRDLVSKK